LEQELALGIQWPLCIVKAEMQQLQLAMSPEDKVKNEELGKRLIPWLGLDPKVTSRTLAPQEQSARARSMEYVHTPPTASAVIKIRI